MYSCSRDCSKICMYSLTVYVNREVNPLIKKNVVSGQSLVCDYCLKGRTKTVKIGNKVNKMW